MKGTFFAPMGSATMLQSDTLLQRLGSRHPNRSKRDIVHIAKNFKNINHLRGTPLSFRDIFTKNVKTSVQLHVLKFLPSMVLPT